MQWLGFDRCWIFAGKRQSAAVTVCDRRAGGVGLCGTRSELHSETKLVRLPSPDRIRKFLSYTAFEHMFLLCSWPSGRAMLYTYLTPTTSPHIVTFKFLSGRPQYLSDAASIGEIARQKPVRADENLL